MIAWPTAAEWEFWLALLLIAGSVWWFWFGDAAVTVITPA